MGNINDKSLYPLDTNVTKDDFVLGSDFDNDLKTVNYSIGSILRLLTSELEFVSTDFRFSDGSDPDYDKNTPGFFFTDSITPASITKLYINKLNLSGQDMTDVLSLVANNVYTFNLKLINSGDPADSFYFKVTGGSAVVDHFELDVTPIGTGYTRTLTDLSQYNLFIEVASTQDNKNIVKYVNVIGLITKAKVATAVNALTSFVVADDQIVYYHATSDSGDTETFVPINLGKGSYGSGGTSLADTDLLSISSSSGSGSQGLVKKEVTYTGPNTTAKVVAAFNVLPSYEVAGGDLVLISASSSDSEYPETYIYAVRTSAGTYGSGETQVVDTDLELISIFGGDFTNIVKSLTITGDPTEASVASAINSLSPFYVGPNQNIYYKATISGTSTSYVFVTKGLGSGNYGTGGTTISGADLSLISVNAGGTSWKLNVGGVEKKVVKSGETIDFRGNGYAVVTYQNGGIVEVSTSTALDNLLNKFKPIISITQADHQALVDAGNTEDALYVIACS